MKPLQGIRVLDLTRVLAGPFCTALLADLGAEIIKLEPPAGDDYRHIGPFLQGESALFTLVNRGKDSIVIDLKAPKGQALAAAIAAQCDVVVENFRPGVAARLGLGAETLRAANPGLIYASISGFGQTGPNTLLPAYDLVAQAMSGLMAATGEEGGAPLKVGESYGDLMAGLYASWAILAALLRRNASGEGATLDVAMFDALFSLLPTSHALQFYAGRAPQRVGNRHPLSTPFGCYPCADGQAVIAVLGDGQWSRLCTLIGAPEAATDPRFATDELRTEHEPAVKALIEAWTKPRPAAEVTAALSAAGIPTAQVQSLAEAAASPQATARGLVSALPHHSLGSAPTIGQPVHFDGEKPIAAASAPALGGQSDAILTRLGMADQIAALRAAGILQGGSDD
ncbi:CaiB/BaiF CoA transferase family protein [Rhodobacter ferrooxidans]|uniref:L-carnitine dehydratase/bile acid-inducible protein F n=1 Tax=Rhodobacter ferrooxidans TaxID=371731 RepID=C8S0V2_9RHOB|nr:CoA transferase [Rhodobacter sp. SW2]EEW25393.1 L-carnitine dehydratase/bile acid-inducible protein F [Rhodobacter sp. SW2]